VIRRATIKDLRRIHKLERICFRRSLHKNQIESLLLNPNAFTLVFEENRKLLGSLILYFDGTGAKVLTISVNPAFRRRGIGKRLMQEAEQVGRFMRTMKLTLEVSTLNKPAIGLYTSLGYQFNGVIENYYSWGDDAYTMSKELLR
jgi:ribosomal-protein-alanine N-acetyltransferase